MKSLVDLVYDQRPKEAAKGRESHKGSEYWEVKIIMGYLKAFSFIANLLN